MLVLICTIGEDSDSFSFNEFESSKFFKTSFSMLKSMFCLNKFALDLSEKTFKNDKKYVCELAFYTC